MQTVARGGGVDRGHPRGAAGPIQARAVWRLVRREAWRRMTSTSPASTQAVGRVRGGGRGGYHDVAVLIIKPDNPVPSHSLLVGCWNTSPASSRHQ